MEQATDSKPNPAFELLAVGLDALVLFGTVAVLYTQGGPALLRTVVLILLLAPAVGQLVAFLTTGGKRFDLLRMGVGTALAAIGLYLWEPEGWTWALPLVGACAVWIVSIKSAASQLAVRRHGRSAPTEEQPPQLSYTHRTILWPDVALLCLWLLPLAGTVVWLLWPAGREYVEATKEFNWLFSDGSRLGCGLRRLLGLVAARLLAAEEPLRQCEAGVAALHLRGLDDRTDLLLSLRETSRAGRPKECRLFVGAGLRLAQPSGSCVSGVYAPETLNPRGYYLRPPPLVASPSLAARGRRRSSTVYTPPSIKDYHPQPALLQLD